MAYKIFITAPNFKRFNNVVIHGGLIYLGEYLHKFGHFIEIDDGLLSSLTSIDEKAISKFKPNILIVDLFRNELLSNRFLEYLLDKIQTLKFAYDISYVIAIGSIARILQREIGEYNKAIDCVVSQEGSYIIHKNNFFSLTVKQVQNYHFSFHKISPSFMKLSGIKIPKNSIISLTASYGCPKKCSFCSYNAGFEKWKSRDMVSLAEEIEFFSNHYAIERFALTDNNFGIDAKENVRRLNTLGEMFRARGISPKISLSISADGLSREVILAMKYTGVDTILVGFESFNLKTLRRLYNKNINFDLAIPCIYEAEKNDIKSVISYILFQPWLSYDELLEEIKAIDSFGRHRLVHFAAKSILQVIPHTKIEKKLDRQQLLIKSGFSRKFRFLNSDIANIYSELSSWTFKKLAAHRTFHELSKIKIAEWEMLKGLVNF